MCSIVIGVLLAEMFPAAILLVPALLVGRRRVSWRKWEMAGFGLPLALWFGLIVMHGTGKSLANLVMEPIVLGGTIGVAGWVRVGLGDRVNQVAVAVALQGALLGAAVAVWWLMPGLAE